MGRINILLGEEIHRKAKSISALNGITLNDFILEALIDKIKKK